jgi:hypothetical protein
MMFGHDATVQRAIPLPGGERSDRTYVAGCSDRACAIRVRGFDFNGNAGSPLTRNGRKAPIPTSPHNPGLPGLRSLARKSGVPDLRWGEVELLARSQQNI